MRPNPTFQRTAARPLNRFVRLRERSDVRLLWTFVAASLVAASACAADVIPPNLVGVWATENAVLRGPYLMQGQAIYLGPDGVGAVVGGPPPIGFKIVGKFDPATNSLNFDAYEGEQHVFLGPLSYDPTRETIDTGAPKHLPMTRRFSNFSDEMRKGLGL
jgi:hypothetical protein